jgi:hypothetical protein
MNLINEEVVRFGGNTDVSNKEATLIVEVKSGSIYAFTMGVEIAIELYRMMEWFCAPKDSAAAEEKTVMGELVGIIEEAGGKVDYIHHPLPDGSGFMIAAFPLPHNHWIHEPAGDAPAPMRMGTDDPGREEWIGRMRVAARYAIKASTMNGAMVDFDPDAMEQNFIIAMLGYNTPDGHSDSEDLNRKS